MLAIERTYNSGGSVNTACWTEPLQYAGSMTCMTTRGENFMLPSNNAGVWFNRIAQANMPARPAPTAPIAPAATLTLDLTCSVPVVTKGKSNIGRNQVTSLRVTRDSRAWRILYNLANGDTISRGLQYDGGPMGAENLAKFNAAGKSESDKAIAGWSGTHRSNPDLTMAGLVFPHPDGSYNYGELLWSAKRNDFVLISTANCLPVSNLVASVPPAAPAPPASTPGVTQPGYVPQPSAPGPAAQPANNAFFAPMTFEVVKNNSCDNSVAIAATGQFAPGVAKQFLETVNSENSKNNQVVGVVFQSPGGALGEALRMGRIVRGAKMNTRVSGGCVSACAFAFLGGVDRHAAANVIGVHQFSSDEKIDISAAQSIVAELLNYTKEMGISSNLITTAEETPPKDVHWLSSVELNNLGVATK